jgi:glucose dehydrogenase
VVALNGDNGNLAWFRQVRPHDLFDLDFQLSPILARVSVEGNPRNVVIGGGKNGEVVAFDRRDGEILWRTPVGLHKNTGVDPVPPTGITVLPGVLGGIETPMAFAEGVVYAAYLDVPTTFSPSGIVSVDLAAGTSGVVAIDAATGDILWERTFDVIDVGAVTVVNDLVFTSLYDGRILALDRATGGDVWSVQAPAGVNGWLAVAGDTILVPAGVGSAPQLIALRLGTTNPMPSPGGAESRTRGTSGGNAGGEQRGDGSVPHHHRR